MHKLIKSCLWGAVALGGFVSIASAGGEMMLEPSELGQVELEPFGFSPSLGPNHESSALEGMAVSAGFIGQDMQIIGLNAISGSVVGTDLATWDGVIVHDPTTYQTRIYHKNRVEVFANSKGGVAGSFNLQNPIARDEFAAIVEARELTFFQSPLIIVNGALDVRPVADADMATRRFYFENEWGGGGVYQTTTPMTLYEAAKELHAIKTDAYGNDLTITMAINLPMGEADYCMKWATMNIEPCGRNSAEYDGYIPFFIVLQSYMP